MPPGLRIRPALALLAAAILSFVAYAIGGPGSATAHEVTLRVMTQNMYQGTNFEELFAATTPLEFVTGVTASYQEVLASKPAERAAAAVLEATILRTGQAPATDVASDQLQALLAELRRLGLHYETVAMLPGTDSEAPTLLGFDVRLTDRTHIIARADLAGPRLRTSNMQVQDYLVNSVINFPVGPPAISKAGWAAVDVTVSGHTLRFADTHLEVIPPFTVQRAQAAVATAISSRPFR